MSMTQEEAVELLRDTPIDIRSTREDDIHTLYATAQMMAIDALRHVSREQDLEDENMELKRRIVNWRKYMAPTREKVEKVWRGEWITKHYVDGILEGTNFDECSKCGYQRVFENPELKTKYIFCPNCGAPMTDEAVQMVMERINKMEGMKK